MISNLALGDELAVTEARRLGRTTADNLLLVDDRRHRGVQRRILNLGINPGARGGGLVLTMMAGLTKYARELLRERQRRGIEAARQRGKHVGRPALLTAGHAETAILWLRTESLAVIASEWRVSERTPLASSRELRGKGFRLPFPAGEESGSGGAKPELGTNLMAHWRRVCICEGEGDMLNLAFFKLLMPQHGQGCSTP